MSGRIKSEKRNGLIGMRVIATLGIALYHFELSFPFVEGKQFMSMAYLFVEFFSYNVSFFYDNDIIKKRKDFV